MIQNHSRREELKPEGKALQQIKDKAHADKYRAMGRPIHLIGAEYSRARRNVPGFSIKNMQNS